MKRMSKKGTVILLMSSLAFLLIVFLLGDYQLKADYLGQRELEVISIADEAESALLYIDQMMRISIAETWGETYGRYDPKYDIKKYIFAERCRSLIDFAACKSDFERAFKSPVFQKNLKHFNKLYNQDFKVEDFSIEIKPYGSDYLLEGLEIIGFSEKKLKFEFEDLTYQINPSFHIERFTIGEMDLLTGKSEALKKQQEEKESRGFFDVLSEIMQNCVSVTENTECKCDGPDIYPQGSSEDYTMNLTWVAEEEYKLRLLRKGNVDPEKEETIKGRLIGVYISKDERKIFDKDSGEYEIEFDEPYYVVHYPEHKKGIFVMYLIRTSERGTKTHPFCARAKLMGM